MAKIEGVSFILFDVDNTLVSGSKAKEFYQLYSRVLEKTLAKVLGVPLPEGVEIANSFREKRDGRGEAAFVELGLGLKAYYDAIVKLQPKNFFVPQPEVNKMLGRLKKRGFGLGALTDSPTQLSRRILQAAGVNQEYFDPFLGWERGYNLPKGGEEEIFLEITRSLGLKSEEILMVGDSLGADISPALKVGLRTVHISPKRLLKEQITVKSIEDLERLLI